ncbi:glutamate-5-semialdehyde dehydrogenase [uncultured Senegalimassilia sp.]|uniref:glutamate-5-semialdehyde dehydrogenase n=1 Tax=uncultured Senegalimassilia sp. TaxID=1714350 RepID=UPI0025841079|nr:glutamate-5-semialdehyde dehydrogenase [uncultured Senegalimassilia sp.]
MTASLEQEVRTIAEAAKAAAAPLAQISADVRNNALAAMAAALRANRVDELAANAQDMDAARAAGTQESLLDRLMLDEARIEAMAGALEELVALPDPLGRVQEQRTLESGIQLTRVSVPLGVVAVVYEARPNVTADAAGICLKSGNACVLRGGSLAAKSCAAIAHVLHDAAVSAGMPAGCIGIIESTDRAAADVLMSLHGIVDVLVPRGGAGLIRHCVECAKVPVIETGTGNCHVYVHETADFARARSIVVNAKCRRYGVCNACETLLVDEAVALGFLPELFGLLADKGVHIHGDELACKAALAAGADRLPVGPALRIERATEADWGTEYLAPELAVCCVSGVDQAIAHINRYGTKHSESIVADEGSAAGAQAIERFVNEVDAAAVYVNASTAFTDGGMFGLGAEIGISTQKLHVRGPFALEGLTSYKYVLRGTGQVRA